MKITAPIPISYPTTARKKRERRQFIVGSIFCAIVFSAYVVLICAVFGIE